MRTRAAATSISIDWVARVTDVPAAIWEKAFAPPLEGAWWYAALEDAGLEEQFAFAYAVIRRDGQIVGIAPTFLMALPLSLVVPDALASLTDRLGALIPALRVQRTLFVGSPCSEEGTVGLLPGVPFVEIVGALQSALEARARSLRAPMIVWKDMPQARSDELLKTVNHRGLFVSPSFPGAVVEPFSTYASYLAGLGAKKRANFQRRMRQSRQTISLTEEVVRNPSREVIDSLWVLFNATFERGTIKFERLTLAFFHLMGSAGPTRFLILRETQTGRPVAFMMFFQLGDTLINKFIGLDYNLDRKSYLYFRLWDSFVRFANEAGAAVLQSGQTGYGAKLELGHKLTPLVNVSKHSNIAINFIYRIVAQTITLGTLDADLASHLGAWPKAGG